MNPLERDRELSQRALRRYLKAVGFRQISERTSREGRQVHRFSNKRSTFVEIHHTEKGLAYALQTPNDPGRTLTRDPYSIMSRIEELQDMKFGKETPNEQPSGRPARVRSSHKR
jgi:hypothetical protein